MPGTALYAAAQFPRIAREAADRLFSIIVGAPGVIHRISRGTALGIRHWTIVLTTLVAGIAGMNSPARSAVTVTADASVALSYDTNPLGVTTDEAELFVNGGKKYLDDASTSITANLSAGTEGEQPLQWQTQAMYSHVESERFNKLGHSDYNFGASMNWKPTRAFDVSMQASQNRLPLGLADVGGIESTQQKTTTANGGINIRPTPTFQVSLTQGWTRAQQPLLDAADYKFEVNSTGVALGFLGAGRLVPGIAATQSRTRYSGIGDATRIREMIFWGTLGYTTQGLTTFTLSAGRTRRTSHLIEPSNNPDDLAKEGTTSAFTGNLGFQRALTAKTTISVTALRDFQQYDAGANRTLATGIGGSITWAATSKLTVTLDSLALRSTIHDVPVAGVLRRRRDLVRSHAINVGYLATRRVSVSGRLSRQVRNSTVGSAQFNSSAASVELSFRLD